MLNDIARYREATERKEKRPLSESVAASRWRDEIFEPTVAAVPENLWAALPAAEVFHQVLEHRWFLSEAAGKDVGIDKAVASYVKSELPMLRPERIVFAEEPLGGRRTPLIDRGARGGIEEVQPARLDRELDALALLRRASRGRGARRTGGGRAAPLRPRRQPPRVPAPPRPRR